MLVRSCLATRLCANQLANVIVVPKKNGKWHVCVDYSDLNDACSKKTFPLSRIDLVVDATVGHELLSFQDLMFPSDSANTTFISPTGMYCHNVMPFSLKNAGATYQRMMSPMFEPLLGKTMEAYIDDMLVKSNSHKDHLAHLRQAFHLMRLHRL